MRSYSELGHIYRGDPCKEYPGTWIVYQDGTEIGSFRWEKDGDDPFTDAKSFALKQWEECLSAVSPKISVCWCSDDADPRIGQVWFSGFYQWGWLNSYGTWRD
jgi:hypothetical protein